MISDDGQISNQHAAMLVELDCIFDTRLGTLAKFGLDVYRDVQLKGYYNRVSDHFPGVDDAEFKKLYRERDAVTLSMSGITHVVSIVRDFVSRVHNLSATSPIKKIPRVDINLHPYNPPQSTLDLIEKALRVLIKDRFDLGYVKYSPEDLHYDLIKHTYDHAVMYNIGLWISAQGEDWEKRNRAHSDLTVFIPLLAHGSNKEEIPSDISNLAEEFERTISPLVNVMQMPVVLFSQVASPFTSVYSHTSPEAQAPGEFVVEKKD